MTCVIMLPSLSMLHQIVSKHQHYPETGRNTRWLINLFYLDGCKTSRHEEILCVYVLL